VDRAREGKGPTLLELRTYRRKGHAQHDPQLYVPPEEIRAWEAKDPIELFRGKLLTAGWAKEEELRRLEVAAETEMREEAESAVGDPPPAEIGTLSDVYTDLPTQPHWTRSIPPGLPSPGGGWRIQGKGRHRD
jgi:TPP-dependent pyruvate/acetoin dehydrogenase alpha subunit